jgi:hypothetical protein
MPVVHLFTGKTFETHGGEFVLDALARSTRPRAGRPAARRKRLATHRGPYLWLRRHDPRCPRPVLGAGLPARHFNSDAFVSSTPAGAPPPRKEDHESLHPGCGLGTRLSEETAIRPKPMVEIGGKSILLHIMKMYSHHGQEPLMRLAEDDQLMAFMHDASGNGWVLRITHYTNTTPSTSTSSSAGSKNSSD